EDRERNTGSRRIVCLSSPGTARLPRPFAKARMAINVLPFSRGVRLYQTPRGEQRKTRWRRYRESSVSVLGGCLSNPRSFAAEQLISGAVASNTVRRKPTSAAPASERPATAGRAHGG